MKTSDFFYALPEELIAQTPIEPRDLSRMLVVHRATGALEHRHFYDILDYLRPGDALVVNDTKVIPARLTGERAGGGACEVLLLKQLGPKKWEALVRPGKKLRPGAQASFGGGKLVAKMLEATDAGGRIVEFFCEGTLEALLDELGEMPLPPYIHEKLENRDRYQTVYARQDGSAAAPTAGLHFTPELLVALRERGVNLAFVTLHIGLDTFRPVQAEDIEQHHIHREWASLSAETARAVNETRLSGGRVIAIGTTVVRTLESAAKIALGYRPCDDIPEGAVCGWQTVAAFTGETDLYITPGHRFRAVDAMLTNFHLPRSTLLMLVSAFAGKELIDRAYAEAIRERYRFYSFGDAMVAL